MYATATAALEQPGPAVEPLFNKLKAWCGIATRYGKTPVSSVLVSGGR